MSKEEFMQICKATLPNGYFSKEGYVIFFQCITADGHPWYLARFVDNKARPIGCLPWYHESFDGTETDDRETFALNLKDVIPPEDK